MRILWNEPLGISASIDQYQLDRRKQGEEDWSQIYQGAAMEELSKGLEPGICYEYRVCACNVSGWGPWSSPCSGATKELQMQPSVHAKEFPIELDDLAVRGTCITNDPNHEEACICILQTSCNKNEWEDVMEVSGCKIEETLHEINRYYRVVVKHPSGAERESDVLHLRLQEVGSKDVDTSPGRALATPREHGLFVEQPEVEMSPSSSDTSLRCEALQQQVKELQQALGQAQAALEASQAAIQLSQACLSTLGKDLMQ